MKPNFLKESSTLVAEIEKKTEKKAENSPKTNIFAPKPQTNTPIPAANPQTPKVEKPKINLFSAKTFEDAKEQEKPSILFVKKAPVVEEAKQPEVESVVEEQDLNEEFVAFSSKPKTHKKEWKFRIKLLTAVYCATIAVLTGWVTTNAIRIASINNTISSTQTSISVNQAKFINEIQKLDDLQNQEPDYNNTELIPIGEVISVTPLPLEDVTEYEKESNWFDNIVNWFGNLFGG